MGDTQIIIKSERHSSRADFDEERKLLREGVDHLIIEEAEKEAQYSPKQYWFRILMWNLKQFFFRIFYVDNGTLKDIALAQEADIRFTRESNASVVENAGFIQQVVSVAVMSICIFSSAYIGTVGLEWWTNNWNYLISIALLPLAILYPVYIIRDSDSDNKEGNRDKIIADKITNSAKQGGIVVAVLGNRHAREVYKNVSEEFNPEFCGPVYSTLSFANLIQNSHSIFVFISVWVIIHQIFIRAASLVVTLF